MNLILSYLLLPLFLPSSRDIEPGYALVGGQKKSSNNRHKIISLINLNSFLEI